LIEAGGVTGATLTLAVLDELLDAVTQGADALFMNKTMRRKVNTLIRAAGQAQETVSDVFGRQIPSYAGIPIRIVDRDEDNAQIFPFTEFSSDGTTALSTSIYAVKFGENEDVTGLQNPLGMQVKDLGEIEASPLFRTRIEWISTIAILNGESVGRLRGITNT